ncbi:hypothetical protein [Pedobacter zeae]|uniref:Uncharacterized protein n=1 Tax=Pedobacter zeae TaxID=1737356 RepID=A0A7W6K9N9_9SPHI|nr:hypothetical protein [Pedobacter zeae]MBB4107759.1 hypothetical protein [Pedobacter zeae]GGG97231.1 hypothetical protein GCM10007422_08950 [Pedobacter zeae]
MSTEKKTWLGRVFASIAALFMNNYESWLKKLWKNIAEELKPDLINIVQIIERVKSFVDGPGIDLITAAIPGEVDDKAVAWLRSILHNLLAELDLTDKPTSELTKVDKQSLATRFTEEVTGLPFDQASTTIKTAYWNVVKLVN